MSTANFCMYTLHPETLIAYILSHLLVLSHFFPEASENSLQTLCLFTPIYLSGCFPNTGSFPYLSIFSRATKIGE